MRDARSAAAAREAQPWRGAAPAASRGPRQRPAPTPQPIRLLTPRADRGRRRAQAVGEKRAARLEGAVARSAAARVKPPQWQQCVRAEWEAQATGARRLPRDPLGVGIRRAFGAERRVEEQQQQLRVARRPAQRQRGEAPRLARAQPAREALQQLAAGVCTNTATIRQPSARDCAVDSSPRVPPRPRAAAMRDAGRWSVGGTECGDEVNGCSTAEPLLGAT